MIAASALLVSSPAATDWLGMEASVNAKGTAMKADDLVAVGDTEEVRDGERVCEAVAVGLPGVDGEGVVEAVRVPDGEEEGVALPDGVKEGVALPDGVQEGVSLPEGVPVGVGAAVPEPEAVADGVAVGDGVADGVREPVAVFEGVCEGVGGMQTAPGPPALV